MSEEHTTPSRRRIGLIAGGGQFPLLFAEGARRAGYTVTAVGFEGETDPALADHVESLHWVKLGQLSRLIKAFRKDGIRRAAMAGSINKTKLYARIRPDWRALKLLRNLHNKKDDSLLRALAAELESEGIRIEPSTLFLPSLLAPEGILTRRKPNARERLDVEFGWELAKAVGHLDIGQCLVVKDQSVLAVEGIDGTDATIRRGGALCGEGAVVVKVCKPIQDIRFDVPVVGPTTIQAMKDVKAKVLAVEAGRTLIFDLEETVAEADRAGITIVARKGGEAPVEPEVTAEPAGKDTARGSAEKPLPRVFVTCERAPDAVRVGVVGVGYLGFFHAQKYAGLPSANLVGVADINRSRAEEVAKAVQTQAYTSHRELLGRVEAVSIATPTPEHYAIARDFLEAGVHVLVEKPMTPSLAEADDLVALARRKQRVLQVGHLERFNPAFRTVAPHIRQPMFIEAHRLALFNERGIEVNVVLDLMIHDIDIALHLVRSPVVKISASGVPVLTALPDIANVRIEFANRAVANLTASRISVKNLRRIRIFQADCYLVADYGIRRAFMYRKEPDLDESGFPEISAEELEVEERDALEEEIGAFIESVRSGCPPCVDGEQGRNALAVALEISRQIQESIQGLWRKSEARP